MTLIETIFTSMFTGFCSYLGARMAKKTARHVKKKKLTLKYLKRRLL